MGASGTAKAVNRRLILDANNSVPQGRLGNNGATSSVAQGSLHAGAAPLERQTASFGSFDFLKLLETGPSGEPLTFAEVLAANPDGTEHDGFQGGPGVQALEGIDTSRSVQSSGTRDAPDKSSVENVMKKSGTGGADIGLLGLPSLPSWGQASLGPLLSAGFSGNFGELLRHPSLSSQLNKDPSFNSAMLHSIFSQRSEDQAALMSMLGQEQSKERIVQAFTSVENDTEKGHQQALVHSLTTRTNPPAERVPTSALAQPPAQLPGEASDAVLAESAPPAGKPSREATASGGSGRPSVETLPVVLPRFSEELEAVKRMPSPKHCQAYGPALRQGEQRPHAAGSGPRVLNSKVMSRNAGSPQDTRLHQQHARLLASLNNRSMDGHQRTGRASRERQAGQPSERAASLDYLLCSANLSDPAPAGAQLPGLAAGPPLEGRRSFQPLAGNLQAGPALDSLPAQPAWSRQGARKAQAWEVERAGRPSVTSALALNAAETLRTLQLPKPMSQSNDSQPTSKSQADLHPPKAREFYSSPAGAALRGSFEVQAVAGSKDLPLQPLAPLRPASAPAASAGVPEPPQPASLARSASQHQSQPSQAAGRLPPEMERSKFLNGLVGGLGPRLGQPNGLPSEALPGTGGLHLPRPPQMKPLPPLPHVPTIAEFQRTISGSRLTSLTSPVEIPRLEVLPLVGVGAPQAPKLAYPPPIAPLNTARPPPAFQPNLRPPPHLPTSAPPVQAFTTPHRAAEASSLSKAAQLQAQPPPPKLAQPLRHEPTPKSRPVPGLPKGDALSGGLQALVTSKLNPAEPSSSGSLDARSQKRPRQGENMAHTKRKALDGEEDLEAEMQGAGEGETSQEGVQGQDRKALRKAKNRASAAASRARREAYTASLEDEVKQLQQKQEWLQARLNEAQASEDGSQGAGQSVKPARQMSL